MAFLAKDTQNETHWTRRELRLRTDPRPVLIEQERARRKEQPTQPDERARPCDAECAEHLHREQRERRADAGPHDRIRGERGSGVLQVGVHQERKEAVEHERHRSPDGHRRERRHDPVHAGVLARPPQPERAQDEHRAADHRAVQALLGGREAAVLDDELGVVLGEGDSEVCADGGADAHADEDKTGFAAVEAASGDEDERDGFEHWRWDIKITFEMKRNVWMDGLLAYKTP